MKTHIQPKTSTPAIQFKPARPATSQTQQDELPDIAAQMERATRFGHSFGRVPVQPAALRPGIAGARCQKRYDNR